MRRQTLRRILTTTLLSMLVIVGILFLTTASAASTQVTPVAIKKLVTTTTALTTTTAKATTTTTHKPKPLPAPTTTQPISVPSSPPPADMRYAVLECMRSYEGAYGTNTGNGFFGAYQFDQQTFDGVIGRVGHPELVGHRASEAAAWIQDVAAWQVYLERGLQPWPTPNKYCHPPHPLPKWLNPVFTKQK